MNRIHKTLHEPYIDEALHPKCISAYNVLYKLYTLADNHELKRAVFQDYAHIIYSQIIKVCKPDISEVSDMINRVMYILHDRYLMPHEYIFGLNVTQDEFDVNIEVLG